MRKSERRDLVETRVEANPNRRTASLETSSLAAFYTQIDNECGWPTWDVLVFLEWFDEPLSATGARFKCLTNLLALPATREVSS